MATWVGRGLHDSPAARAAQEAFFATLFAPFEPAELATLAALLRRWEAALRPS